MGETVPVLAHETCARRDLLIRVGRLELLWCVELGAASFARVAWVEARWYGFVGCRQLFLWRRVGSNWLHPVNSSLAIGLVLISSIRFSIGSFVPSL